MTLKTRVGGTLIAIVVLLFAIIFRQNTEVVTYRALFWEVTMSRILILPAALVIGIMVGFVLGRHRRTKSV